ncbi:MAG: triose-phosphate isomerase, partial [Phycisphaerales bacterium]
VMLGAQDVFHAEKGAFTGEVSVGMLKDVGVQIVLCGHSERRHVMHEGDDLVNAKVNAVLNGGLRCVLCVGEKLEQRTTGQTNTVNERQVRMGVRHVTPDQLDRLVIAYEPVWAIGTGQTASPQDAQDAHAHIRSVLADEFGKEAAEKIRIQYGGSVTAANAAAIMGSAAVAAGADEARLEVVRRLVAQPDVDGGLVGGASLKADEFLAICRAVKQA